MTVGTIECEKCGKECFFVPVRWEGAGAHLCSECYWKVNQLAEQFVADIIESKNADKSLAEPFVFEGESND